MRIKLKNILIVLLTLIGLIFNSQVLADPASKYEEIKAKIDALNPKKCNYLLGKTDLMPSLISIQKR